MSMRRWALAIFDGLGILGAALALLLVTPSSALAYVDPSVMTYTIQALAGVAVALSAVLGVALRRSRRVILRVLHIDENANKQVEPEAHRLEGPDADKARVAADEAAAQAKQELAADRQAQPLPWRQRLLRALVASLFLVGTVFIVAPLEVVAGNTQSLVFGLKEVGPLVIGAGIASAAGLGLLLSALRGKAFDLAVTIVVAIGLGCYVQAMFLNSSLPIADGNALDLLSNRKTITVISTVVWVALFAGLLLLNARKQGLWRKASMALCVVLVLVQGVGLASLFAAQAGAKTGVVVTKEGLYEVGSQDNTIVFLLDTFDTQMMNELLKKDPSVLDEFTGFTYFENSTGSMVPTRYGTPYLLTGNMPDGTKDFNAFMDSWYTESSFIPDIAEAGYDIGIYSNDIENSYLKKRDIEGIELVNEHASNLHDQEDVAVDALGAIGILDKVALYRDAPWLLKPLFWFYTEDVNNGTIAKGDSDSDMYVYDDAAFFEELAERGLAIGEADKAFRFIHLNGAHPPYVVDETGHAASGEVTLMQQCKGSLTMVADYLQNLKDLGLYDDATIIVTADHGKWYITPDVINGPTSPIFLVKPAETAEEAAQPVKVSKVPTGHLDYAATVIASVGGDSQAYGPTAFEVQPGPRERFYWMTSSDGVDDLRVKEYRIDGDVLDFSNWQLTGNEIIVAEK